MANYSTDNKKESFGFGGFVLSFCIFEISIATFNPNIRTGIPGISELNIVIFLLFLLLINRVVIRRQPILVRSYDLVIAAYFFYCFVSMLYGSYLHGYELGPELLTIKTYFNPFVIYFLLKNAIANTKQLRMLSVLVVIILVLGAAYSIIGFFLWPETYAYRGTRSEGIVGQANLYGMSLICLSPILFYYLEPKTFFRKALRFVSIAILLVALFQTGSRGAMLGMIAIFFLIFLKSKQKLRIGIASMLLAPVVLSVFYFSSIETETTMERLKINDVRSLQTYSSGRLGLWQKVIEDIAKRPILGYGFNSHEKVFLDHRGHRGTSPHNEYLYILFNLGMVGLLLYLLYHYQLWHYFKKRKNLRLATACYLGLTGYLIHTAFSQPHSVNYLIWMFMGLAACEVELAEKEAEEPTTNQTQLQAVAQK